MEFSLFPHWDLSKAGTRCPADLEHAADLWGANCGPSALAAVLAVDCRNVRLAFNAGGKWPGYTNPTKMQAAARALGLNLRDRGEVVPGTGRGLLFVQFTGPWERYPREAYRHTHWIAFAWDRIVGENGPEGNPVLFTYDCNWQGPFGAWMPLSLWERSLAPKLIEWHDPAATGWRWRRAYAIESTGPESPRG